MHLASNINCRAAAEGDDEKDVTFCWGSGLHFRTEQLGVDGSQSHPRGQWWVIAGEPKEEDRFDSMLSTSVFLLAEESEVSRIVRQGIVSLVVGWVVVLKWTCAKS